MIRTTADLLAILGASIVAGVVIGELAIRTARRWSR